MIDLNRISASRLETEPYRWAAIDQLFSPEDAAALAATFPQDHFKRIATYDGQKEVDYEIRCLIRMGEVSISRARRLSAAWRALANDFLSPAYRTAMSSLTGIDVSNARLEVNVFHYRPDCVSTVWPSWHRLLLHHYPTRVWCRVKGSFGA